MSNSFWPGSSSNSAWQGHPGGSQPTAPGVWPNPASGPAPGPWPSSASGPSSGPTPGPWPSSAPGSAPGAWPSPAPGSAPGAWPSPAPGPAPGPWPSPGPAAGHQDLTVPFTQILPNGVYDKLLITIAGTIKPNAKMITVDLSVSKDVVFHFNPRFNENGRKVIVRNSLIGQVWGSEERELQHFPFVPGQAFEMKILCTSSEYKVAVDNSHLLTYRHRYTNLRSINVLGIYNDLSLSRVTMETLP